MLSTLESPLCFKSPYSPPNRFHLVKSLYGIRKNAAKMFAFGSKLNFLRIVKLSIVCSMTKQTGEWA